MTGLNPIAMRQIPIALPSTGLEEWEATKECFESGWLTQGSKVAAFEQAFAERHQVQHAVAVTSCTTGLHLALATLGIGPGDEVIVPAFTWIATANVVLYCGATPVFVDIDPITYNLDPKLLVKHLTARTKAVIPVHLFGLCADIAAIKAVLPPHIRIVEDAACASGAEYQGKPAGGLGELGVFSFHPRKSITTGEGGMLTTNDDDLAGMARQLRNHGAVISEEQRHLASKPYLLPNFNVLGFNYRMTDLQGAVGLVQLRKLDTFLEERRQWASFYQEELAGISWLRTPQDPLESRPGWQAYVCYVNPALAPMPRNEMMEILQKRGISTRPGTHAVHMLYYYQQKFGIKAEDFPNARDCDAQTIAIPLHNKMTSDDYHYVVSCLKELDICAE